MPDELVRKSLGQILSGIYSDNQGSFSESELRAIEAAVEMLQRDDVTDREFESSAGVLWMAFGRRG